MHLASLCLCVLAFLPSEASDNGVNISADNLEYLSRENIYIATGSVRITFEDSSLEADTMRLDGNTFDAEASGNIVYENPEATINAEQLELNLKTKIGTIHETSIFYRRHNFHLRSGEINKTGADTFHLDEATVTTCDADPPEWHISGKDITVTRNEEMNGWHGTLNIKDTPVLYTPYFWAPLNRDRQTGLLFPSFGYSSTRGNYYKQGFYWAIRKDQDATFYLDYYGKKGFAEGFDYRYVLSPETDGEIWMYQVRDKQPSRNLFEIKSYHDQVLPYDVTAYLKLHAVSHYDYYETLDSTSQDRFGLSTWENTNFGFATEERLQKYLESDMQMTRPFPDGRIYLLAQGRQSLEGSSREVPQSVPEIGFVLNTQSFDFFSFNALLTGVNFWRVDGQRGMRFDVDPNLYFSFGKLLNVTQRVGLRETAYVLDEPVDREDRFIYDLGTTLTTKFFKKYTTFVHLIEPSLQYDYIPSVNQDDLPFFDSTDSIPNTNRVTYSLTNRLSGSGSESLETRFRLSQSYSLLKADRNEPFTPLLAEVTLAGKKADLSINASYDLDDNVLTETIGSVSLRFEKGYIGFGKSLRRSTELDQYTVEGGIYRPMKLFSYSIPVAVRGKLWYDADNHRFQELNIVTEYKKQCWGFSAAYNEKPGEFQIVFAVELTGLGTVKLGSIK